MKIGIIGGSGLYRIEGMSKVRSVKVGTPFGSPSDDFVSGILGGCEVFFLPRHGRGHRLLPSEINHRANVFAFKKLGVDRVVSVSAVGSLKEKLRPRDIVLPDQYFDRTKRWQDHTFFGGGVVGHISFGEPACPDFRKLVASCAREVVRGMKGKVDVRVHEGGTYVNMEGPAFSTKAESFFYRKMGFDVIGMTSLAEAKLCREAEICYQGMAMVTDYDCWHESREPVTVEMVVAHLMANTFLAKEILVRLVEKMPDKRMCNCDKALANALLTDRGVIPARIRRDLKPILGKYL